MNPYLFIFLFVFGTCGLIAIADYVWAQVDEYRARERVWRGIEIRSCRERHPSNQVSVFDQDAP